MTNHHPDEPQASGLPPRRLIVLHDETGAALAASRGQHRPSPETSAALLKLLLAGRNVCLHVTAVASASAEGVSPADRPGDTVDIDQGPEGLGRYQPEAEAAEGGRRSQGPTSGDTGDGGRFIAGDTAQRFWSKVDVGTGPGGCWLWTGAVTGDGYGRFRVTDQPGRYRHVRAHRWAWEATNGPIPAGLTLDHACHTNDPGCRAGHACAHRRCVRPDHLEAVTHAENIRRAIARPHTTETSP